MRVARAVARIHASTTLISHLGFALLLCAAGWLVIVRGQAIGDILVFFTAIGTSYGSIKRLSQTMGHVQESAGAADRLQSLLDEPLRIRERPLARRIDGLGSGLVFESVSFTYPGGEAPAIAGLDLEIRPGETLALVGPSGAGKTTLIDLIARFIDPDEGRVLADCHDLRDLSLDAWTGLFAMVNQEPFLFHTTILENIRYGRPDASQAEVEAAARAASIHDFILSLPQGYQTNAGDAGSRLSGGQRQRITIARALLKGAPLLLLDEATSALDSESEAAVQEALERLMRGRTVVVIAHRLSTIRKADRIAVLERGRLVELGSHAELLERGGLYARLHAVQFSAPAAKEAGR
jgi:ABC-type multidrug transport system fused ATPase/permease subunit